jgi:diguanylate cyclase (GGDEF)-like protein/PAS domain S-box-containing protein
MIMDDKSKEIERLVNEKLRHGIDVATQLVITDRSGRILYVNDNCLRVNGYTREELIGKHTRMVNANYHPKEFFKEMWDTILSGKVWRGEVKNKGKDGLTYWVDMTIIPMFNENGENDQFLALRYDITEKKKIEFKLEQKDQQLKALIENSNEVIAIINEFGVINYINASVHRVLGNHHNDIIGTSIFQYLEPEDVDFVSNQLKVVLQSPRIPITHQIKLIHNDGGTRWCEIIHTNHLDDPLIKGIVINFRDVTEQKLSQEKIHHMAYYDYLTGLPNRRMIDKKLTSELIVAESNNSILAIMFLDLDGFKHLNDILGHEIGDLLLKMVAERITSAFQNRGFIGRLGGDEFVIITSNMRDYEEIQDLAQKAIETLEAPFYINEFELHITSCIGVSVYPYAGMDVSTLIKNADVAMYRAKQEGNSNFQIYSPSMNENSLKMFILKNDLKKAIENTQLEIYYQPRVNPTSLEICGAEALIRWNHPKYGLVSPGEFIPLAEETGLIIPIGQWIIKEVCQQNSDWQKEKLDPIRISVNLSPMQLLQTNFVANLKYLLNETMLDPRWLELEITESMLLNKEDQVLKTLDQINELGISIALDDFGTGYSALNYLKNFKFDVIKIDRSILMDIPVDQESYEIAYAIVKLAQRLNKSVVAEGVETLEQLKLIQQMGCDEYQGYLCSKPINKRDFKKHFLTKQMWNYVSN